ncbi:MAG: hypothetical protein CMP51_06800 [Flavobacteriales bacterium]|nr:hypothetical protein [Flavobacteriales bacterium]|tara:strand:+ start:397 stop:1125 length:729 start_codon:yes stop_codon:yes gene_type:complete
MKKVIRLLSELKDSNHDLISEKWNYYQEWNDSVFLHFEIPYDLLIDLIPLGLELDCFNEKCYVSLVAFTMNELFPKNLFPIDYISNFHEINIRTYVKKDHKHGVYFINIEAEKTLSSFIAKILSRLPYEASEITRKSNNYRSLNHKKKLEIDIDYNIQDGVVEKSDLDIWLLERYCLFYVKNFKIFRYDIYHKPWSIQALELIRMKIKYRFGNVILSSDNLVSLHYSKGVDVLSWPRVNMSF